MRSKMVIVVLLFIAIGHPSLAQKTAGAGGGGEGRVVRVKLGEPLVVECPLRVEQRAEWRLEGGALPQDLRAAGEAPAARGALLAARLEAPAARAHHAGLYTCSRDAAGAGGVRVLVLHSTHDESTVATPGVAAPAAPPAPPAEAAEDGTLVVVFDVNRNLSLDCSAPPVDPAALTYSWQKNGTDVEKVSDLKGRFVLEQHNSVFRLSERAHEDDFGNYTCLVGGSVAREWRVRGRPIARLNANHNVVEGQKLKLTCKLIGKPYVPVDWTFAKEGGNATLVEEALGGRAELAESAAGVPRGDLVVERAESGDAGVFTCTPRAASGGAAGQAASVVVRVKDMYAALWPFLGICAEVLVLCAIILIYEKRRTKTDLDDSDTEKDDQ